MKNSADGPPGKPAPTIQGNEPDKEPLLCPHRCVGQCRCCRGHRSHKVWILITILSYLFKTWAWIVYSAMCFWAGARYRMFQTFAELETTHLIITSERHPSLRFDLRPRAPVLVGDRLHAAIEDWQTDADVGLKHLFVTRIHNRPPRQSCTEHTQNEINVQWTNVS